MTTQIQDLIPTPHTQWACEFTHWLSLGANRFIHEKQHNTQVTTENDAFLNHLISENKPTDEIIGYLSWIYGSDHYAVYIQPHIHGESFSVRFPDLEYSYGIDIPIVSENGSEGFHQYRWLKRKVS